jgi:NuA3 HAT complex component NTO1
MHATELQDADHGVPTHEEHLIQDTEPPSSIPPTRSEQQAAGLTLAEAKLKFKLEPNMTLSQDPDGKLVIQELDSPVTRREKAMRKKRARSRLEAPIVTAFSTLDGSDLSSLSELSEEDDGSTNIKENIDKTKTTATQPGQVVLEDGKMLDGGTLGEIIVYFYIPMTADPQI